MNLIDNLIGKTIKEVRYLGGEDYDDSNGKTQLPQFELVFTDSTSIKLETVSGYKYDWIEIEYNNLNK